MERGEGREVTSLKLQGVHRSEFVGGGLIFFGIEDHELDGPVAGVVEMANPIDAWGNFESVADDGIFPLIGKALRGAGGIYWNRALEAPAGGGLAENVEFFGRAGFVEDGDSNYLIH